MVNKGVEFQGVLGQDGGSKIKLFQEEGSRCVSNNRPIAWLALN